MNAPRRCPAESGRCWRSVALMPRRRLLALDERGIMPKRVDKIFARFAEIRRDGATVLIVEQRVTNACRSPVAPRCCKRAA